MKTALLFASVCLSATSFAGTMGPMSMPRAWAPMISLSGGPAWTENGKSQTFYLQPDVQKTYAANNNKTTLATGEIFLGLQHPINSMFTGQFGVAFAAASSARLNGDQWEDADPDFNNFYYNYKVNHARIAAKAKLLADFGQVVQPYISGSIGAGFNHAHDFTINTRLFEEIPAPPFTDHTTTALAYTLGIGVQKAMGTNWQVGIGYEFASWGKSNLGSAPGQTPNSSLHLSHLYTNELQLSLSFTA